MKIRSAKQNRLPHNLDKLDIVPESYVDDPLNYESRKLNVNVASVDELAACPGVSRGMARKVVKYRDQHCLFSSFDELSKIWHHHHDDHKSATKTRLLQRWVLTGYGLHEVQFYKRININRDPIEELTLLHGINKSKAKKIIKERETQAFTSIDDPRFTRIITGLCSSG